MKKFLLGFLLGIVAGAAGYWFATEGNHEAPLREARRAVADGAEKIKESIQETVGEIRTDEIKEELARSSMVVREKARQAGTVIADAAANAKVTATIKTRYLTEPNLSALNLNVDTTDGLVTLSGTASSHEEIARAIQIAMDTPGVRKVISTVQIKAPPKQSNPAAR